jgi:hypothetical protein
MTLSHFFEYILRNTIVIRLALSGSSHRWQKLLTAHTCTLSVYRFSLHRAIDVSIITITVYYAVLSDPICVHSRVNLSDDSSVVLDNKHCK